MPKLIKWIKIWIKFELIKIDKELSMKTIEWNEGQRKAFQDLLREFVALIDAKAQEGKQMGKKPKIPQYASCQNGLNKFLAPWGYACKISPGSGYLSRKSSNPSIAFCRQDILGEGFVNGEKPTPKKRFLPLVCLLLVQEGCKKVLSSHRSIHRAR
ncbi:hypothetical protein HMPREF1398_01356 [Helicobacter pylori GAM117Ai]|nr:hypothetical protein HMPREF1398_01356 [Helicobacter pylori GAM117Ai]